VPCQQKLFGFTEIVSINIADIIFYFFYFYFFTNQLSSLVINKKTLWRSACFTLFFTEIVWTLYPPLSNLLGMVYVKHHFFNQYILNTTHKKYNNIITHMLDKNNIFGCEKSVVP